MLLRWFCICFRMFVCCVSVSVVFVVRVCFMVVIIVFLMLDSDLF